jgi:hypothetical protein
MGLEKVRRILRENTSQLLDNISVAVIPIPEEICCGKSVVFLNGRKYYTCSRCETVWKLTVSVRKNKRTDWNEMQKELNALHSRLQKKPRTEKKGYIRSPGDTLNAYMAGDIGFKKAVAKLNQWKRRP